MESVLNPLPQFPENNYKSKYPPLCVLRFCSPCACWPLTPLPLVTEEDVKRLIEFRASNEALFTGKRNSAKIAWRYEPSFCLEKHLWAGVPSQLTPPPCVSPSTILRGLGLEGKLTADQIAKKWDNLRTKYKVRGLTEAAAGCQKTTCMRDPVQETCPEEVVSYTLLGHQWNITTKQGQKKVFNIQGMCFSPFLHIRLNNTDQKIINISNRI